MNYLKLDLPFQVQWFGRIFDISWGEPVSISVGRVEVEQYLPIVFIGRIISGQHNLSVFQLGKLKIVAGKI